MILFVLNRSTKEFRVAICTTSTYVIVREGHQALHDEIVFPAVLLGVHVVCTPMNKGCNVSEVIVSQHYVLYIVNNILTELNTFTCKSEININVCLTSKMSVSRKLIDFVNPVLQNLNLN